MPRNRNTRPLTAASNLSDVTSTATSRANLGLGSVPGGYLTLKGALDSGPAGTYRGNMLRQDAVSNLAAIASGVMTSVLVYLEAGDVVTNLTFVSGLTAAVLPTHWWFGLYSPAATPVLLAQTTDQTTTAWAADTVMTVPLTTPYTVATTGLHYAAVMVTATTIPTLRGLSLGITGIGSPVISGQKNLVLTSGTGLVAAAPSTITSAAAAAVLPFALAT